MTKLYIVEWDGWSFSEICKTKAKAQSLIRSYMESIKEIEVIGNILNDDVFIVIDNTGDYGGVHSNYKSAKSELDGYYEKDKFEIQCIKLLD